MTEPRPTPHEERADPRRLRKHVEALEGERHWESSPRGLAGAITWVTSELRRLGWETHQEPFSFRGGRHQNVVAFPPWQDPGEPRILIGAHIDTVRGTPGADDNASGVAGVLEVAHLWGTVTPRLPVELAIWTLEERRGLTYRVGSRRHISVARRAGVRYIGALVLEMIGYCTHAPRSQRIPLPIRWMRLPRTGNFIAAIGDWQSKALLRRFAAAASRATPHLPVVALSVPFRGWSLPATRRSDNASFWSAGYPALMITDTADLRNPNYHRPGDTSSTLDYSFMAGIVDAVVATGDVAPRE